MNQAELQQLARERILDAKALLEGNRWAFAYYTAGYAVECALKSCLLARMIHTGFVFQEKLTGKECLTHDFGKLIELAGLMNELNSTLKASNSAGGAFVPNWGTVTQWKPTSRYESKTETEARSLYAAITDNPDGVLPWIQKYWKYW